MEVLTIESIKRDYRDVYDSSKNIHLYEQDVIDNFRKIYKDNANSYISKYNFEKILLQQGRPSNNNLTELARNYFKLFDIYIDKTYEMKTKVGAEKTRIAMGMLDEFFENKAKYHTLSSST